MKKTCIIFIAILLSMSGLFAVSKEDSLRQAINNYHGVAHIDARLKLAFLLRKSNFEEAKYQGKTACLNAQKLADSDWEALALYYLGLTYYYNDAKDSALYYLIRSEETYKTKNNTEQLAKVLCMIGTNYLGITGDQEKAISYYNEALHYAREYSDYKTMAMIYSQLSNIFRMNGAYQQAVEFIYKSKENYEKIGFTEGVAWIDYSIGRIYNTMGLYEEAEKTYLEGLQLYRELPETVSSLTGVAICLDELGLAYLELGDTKKARGYNVQALEIYREINAEFGISNALKYSARIEYMAGNTADALICLDKSLKIKKNMNDVLGFPGVYNLYGLILLDQQRYQQAVDSLNVGLQYAFKNNQKNRIISLNKHLAQVYYELEEYDKAFDYQSQQVAISDSIYKSKATRGMTQLEALYDLETRETKIKELKQENLIKELELTRKTTARNLLLIILGISSVFFFFLLKLFLSNRQANVALEKNQQKLQELNATKDKFFSIIAHDLKNPFNTIIGFSTLMGRYCQQKDYEKIEEFSGHIREVSTQTFKLLENLLDWSRSQTGIISFLPKSLDIRASIQNAVDLLYPAAKQKDVHIEVHAGTIRITADENMMHAVLQNLLSNAIKYSHTDGNIHITAEENEGMLEVSVQDEGVGIDEDTRNKLFCIDKNVSQPGTDGEKGTGLGLIISKEFIQRHRGNISVESKVGKGTCFTFRIPKEI